MIINLVEHDAAYIRLVETIVWPALIAWLAFSLKNELRALLGRVARVEYGAFKAEFENFQNKYQDSNYINSEASDEAKDEKTLQLLRLAKVNASSAIIDAWREVELASISAALYKNLSVRGPKQRVSGGAAINSLLDDGSVNKEHKSIYNDLKRLRKLAINDKYIVTSSDAKNYVRTAMAFSDLLLEIK